MHLDCRVLAASGCPLLSCWRNMAKLRYGLTYIFLDNDLHFLENHSRLPGRRRNSPLTLRAGMHGGAVMRIGPTFTAVGAIPLVAAADVHSDGSGLAEQATRSAQPRRLAQAPEPSSPPTAQPGAESPPSTAPAPPAGAPPNPSPGTPAMVFDDQEVSTILGKSVRSTVGEDMGRIVDIIVSRDGQVHAAIIDFGGGSRHWHAQDRRRLARAEFCPGRKARIVHPGTHPQPGATGAGIQARRTSGGGRRSGCRAHALGRGCSTGGVILSSAPTPPDTAHP